MAVNEHPAFEKKLMGGGGGSNSIEGQLMITEHGCLDFIIWRYLSE
jgi:hypothetical protein